jgi:H+/Cl- antiporter ClcA
MTGTARDLRGDFTITPRVLPIAAMAVFVGAVSTLTAVVLLDLIAFFTNLFFYGRFSIAAASPADNHLGAWVIAIPVIGSLLIGVLARFGSERIRGHGIPEAIEAILLRGSRIEPKVALLKPLSSAISIGSGGPFGAEGPIIMTGGAIGSILAQMLHLTAAERKTLLVAGAAAGMSAVFATPIAAVLLAVELLLFEWKPRSVIPVALASATAAVLRPHFLGNGPLFPVPEHGATTTATIFVACLFVGATSGLLSGLLTHGVYAAEDAFGKLKLHWMWWPALGAVVVGVGGWLEPHALGVGYDNIAGLLSGSLVGKAILGLIIVKAVIWIVSLGSGTSGGVLAPLLTLGAALGGLEAGLLPEMGAGFWPLVGMGAILGGTMRSPLTSVLFALELTRDFNSMLPLLVAVAAAYLVTALLLPRSILTEKIARRGFHVSREYATDPLEIIFAREVMNVEATVLPASMTGEEARASVNISEQRLFPIVDQERFLGVLTAQDLQAAAGPLGPLARTAISVWSDDVLRIVVNRMAETSRTCLPVLEPGSERVVGLVRLQDLLQARVRHIEEERRRERPIALRVPRFRGPAAPPVQPNAAGGS